MAYNIPEIAFYAAALHLSDLRMNLLEETVDDLCRQNKISEDKFDLIEEFAEQLVDVLLNDNQPTPGIGMFGDIVTLNPESPALLRLRAYKDEFIASYENCLEQLADEEEELIRTADIDEKLLPNKHSQEEIEPPDADAFDIDSENEKSEAELMRDQIKVALHILDDMTSNMTNNEQDELLNAALRLDDICKKRPLHVHYDRLNKRPS